mmetsp:Transcript_47115/g.123633  ORF Transcript_47115/g.123633 Transcript_47115/m.123633 type:complete len:109 (-) Transcript_47115:92-418(-)
MSAEEPTGSSGLGGGQCTTNPLVGEWYSLPSGGECAPAATPGDGTCAWRASLVKTIDAWCLFGKGYLDACKADGGRAPFAKAKELFLSAFASEDDTKGGCPALPGPDR